MTFVHNFPLMISVQFPFRKKCRICDASTQAVWKTNGVSKQDISHESVPNGCRGEQFSSRKLKVQQGLTSSSENCSPCEQVTAAKKPINLTRISAFSCHSVLDL